jgi:formiminotetrahydrofolate cyclodeaminase
VPVGEFLARVAARTPAPGGGGACAVTAALAAALTAMAARFSAAQLSAAGSIAEQADGLRHRVAGLADEDAAAYKAVLDAFALPSGAAGRRERIRDALHGAAIVPLEIAEIAAQTGQLAAAVAAGGNPNLRGDAITAACLAEAAARSAATLVDINVRLGGLPEDLFSRAGLAVAAARAAAARAAAARAAAARAANQPPAGK